MGAVYCGFDPYLDRRVAIKTILPGAVDATIARDLERRFLTEARSVARLRHPGIVSLYDVGLDEKVKFLVMELVEGISLHDCIRHGVRFSIAGCLQIGVEVLAALEHAHHGRVIHRDIKPSNILVEWNGAIRLADFGVAKIQEIGADNGTQLQGVSVGTLRYMSPEQALGNEVDGRSDLFSTAVMLHELLTTFWPFEQEGVSSRLESLLFNEAPAISRKLTGVGPDLDAVFHRALQKKPEHRYQTAAEFRLALESLLQALPRRAVDPRAVPATALALEDSVVVMARLIESARFTDQGPAELPDSNTADPAVESTASDSELVTRTRLLQRMPQSNPSLSGPPTGQDLQSGRSRSPGTDSSEFPRIRDSSNLPRSPEALRVSLVHADHGRGMRGSMSNPESRPDRTAGRQRRAILRFLPAVLLVLGGSGYLWSRMHPTATVPPPVSESRDVRPVLSQPPLPLAEPEASPLPGGSSLPLQVDASIQSGQESAPPLAPALPSPISRSMPETRPVASLPQTMPAVSDRPASGHLPPVVAPRSSVSRCSFLLEKAGSGEPLSNAEQSELISKCR